MWTRFLKRRPRSYFEQERACRNCRHVFVYSDQDEGSTYFCTFRAPPRPRCGSCTMHERWDWDDKKGRRSDRAFRQGMRLWDLWSRRREVEPWGICDEFRHREEET